MPAESTRRMGRPRGFDEDEVIARATSLFWAQGFRPTTVEDLTQATGLGAQSLYGAFGDKRGLFLRALERYMRDGLIAVAAQLESGQTPLRGLRCYLEQQLALACGDSERQGCLMAHTALELLPGDADVADLVNSNFAGLHNLLRGAVRHAQSDGEIEPHRDPTVVAWQLLALVEGLQVLGRTVSPTNLKALVTGTLEGL
jgi:TetR/AcrR family transcriptional repressor of nem operon